MGVEILMPRLSDSMEEGTILTWMKQVGDEIAVGEEIVEIETDKANMAYESDLAGTLNQILAQEGDTLPIGAPIAVVGDPGEGPSPSTAGPAGEEETSPSQQRGGSVEASSSPAPTGGTSEDRVKASPVARRLAKERGVDIASLTGSGPGGRIVKKDVKQAAKAEATAPPTPTQQEGVGGAETAKGEVEVVELTKLQQTVARRMAESKATAPHFYLQTEIDMSAAVEGRRQVKELAGEDEVVPSFNDMVVKACALALREHPKANGAYRDGRFELYSRINVGVAVAAQDALVVPTVFDADKKGLRQIAADARALAAKVRDGSITPPELSGATFTVSNLGMYGITNFSAVINAPQAAILAVGAILERPVVRDGELSAAHLMGATLSCDHRILYGAEGAEFLGRVKRLLEAPVSLAL